MKRVKLKSKFYGYITTGSNERKSGVAKQRKLIKNSRLVNTIEYYKDINVPNDAGLEDRPALCEILKKIRRIDYLLVAEKDRLNEDNFLGCWLEKESKIKGFELHYADEKGRRATRYEKLLNKISSAFAEYDTQQQSKRVQDALNEKRKKGERIGTIPYGYDLEDDKKMLVANRVEQKVISRISRMESDGESLRSIASHLNEIKVDSPKGGKWNATTIFNILKRNNEKSSKSVKKRRRKRVKVKR